MLTKAVAISAIILLPNAVMAFWDAGHMLVGEIASQYMYPEHVSTLNALLSHWEEEFPNTSDITTATVWADIIKCDKPASYCPTKKFPSIKALDRFHYSGLALDVRVSNEDDTAAAIIKQFANAHGSAHEVLSDTLSTFQSTKSIWAANFMLRFMLHSFGDIHQPLHTANAKSAAFPDGDRGGNMFVFQQPCQYRNLHALWDAMGGHSSFASHAWNVTMSKRDRTALTRDALKIMITDQVQDSLNFTSLLRMSYDDFVSKVLNEKLIESAILESMNVGKTLVYGPLDLRLNTDGEIACPRREYINDAGRLMVEKVHLAGYRLSVILTQLASQVERLMPDLKSAAL